MWGTSSNTPSTQNNMIEQVSFKLTNGILGIKVTGNKTVIELRKIVRDGTTKDRQTITGVEVINREVARLYLYNEKHQKELITQISDRTIIYRLIQHDILVLFCAARVMFETQTYSDLKQLIKCMNELEQMLMNKKIRDSYGDKRPKSINEIQTGTNMWGNDTSQQQNREDYGQPQVDMRNMGRPQSGMENNEQSQFDMRDTRLAQQDTRMNSNRQPVVGESRIKTIANYMGFAAKEAVNLTANNITNGIINTTSRGLEKLSGDPRQNRMFETETQRRRREQLERLK